MTNLSTRTAMLLVCALLFSACAGLSNADEEDGLQGRLLVWHTWEDPHGPLLREFLSSFMDIHPGVRITAEYVPLDDVEARFTDRISAGLGPDLLVGVDLHTVGDLLASGALVDLNEYEFDAEHLLPNLRSVGQVEESLYAVPISAHTEVLFFNRELVDGPATNLDELLAEARDGKTIAIPADFHHSYWGVRAFGGRLLDREGKLAADQGLIDWLTWVRSAQSEPTVVLSDRVDELQDLFVTGRAAYFIGDSREFSALHEALGEQLGVATLPFNQSESADDEDDKALVQYVQTVPSGSFLELDMIALSNLSTQPELALQLMDFLTNPVQQRELALANLGHIPVNASVRLNSRVSPSEATMIRQSTNTMVIPLLYTQLEEELRDAADEIYVAFMEGELEPGDAIVEFAEALRELSMQRAELVPHAD